MYSSGVQVMFTCFLCDKKLDNKSDYREHMKICVFLSDEGTQLFPCFLCDEEFASKTEYREHLKMCVDISDFTRNNFYEQMGVTVPFNRICCEKNCKNAVDYDHDYDADVKSGVCTIDHQHKNREDREVAEGLVTLASGSSDNLAIYNVTKREISTNT